MKKLLTVLLVAFAIGGMIMAIKNQQAAPVAAAAEVAQAGQVQEPSRTEPEHVVQVTYFTTNVRCPSCLKIEDLTRKTVDARFAKEASSGAVIFQLINTDLPENQHFIQDYQLVSKTVVVAEFDKGVQGDWVNLQDVWLKLKDPEAFEDYVASAVTDLL